MLHLTSFISAYCLFLAAVFGACMGSFLNCMAWRIVHGESLWKGRSHCDSCGHVLSARELIPIASYFINKKKCRYCGAKLSAAHLWAEAATALTFLALLLKYDIAWKTLELALFASILLCCAFADMEGSIIPDGCILLGILLRIGSAVFLGITRAALLDAALGGFGIGGALLLVVLLYERIKKTEAMGGGDIKLFFLTGLFFGWRLNLLCLLFSCLFGIAFAAVTGKARAGGESKAFPWGPSITAAAIFTLLWGQELMSAYLRLF